MKKAISRGLLGLGLLALGLAGALAQEKKPAEPGRPAPPLGIEQWIQPGGNAGLRWEDLQGKVVVLEFWATWCGPCVAAIPHSNQLVRKFQGRPVEFFSISDEEEVVVKKFLAARPIEGWVGLDTDRSMFNDYGVHGIPQTVLVDARGAILAVGAVGEPDQVTEAVLEDALAGKGEAVRAKVRPAPPLEEGLRTTEDALPALYEVVIRPAKPGSSAMQRTPNQFLARGMRLELAFQNAYGVTPERMVLPEWLGETLYDFLVTVPRGQAAQLPAILQHAIEAALNLNVRRETREVDAYLLVAPQGRTAGLRDPAGTGGMSRSQRGKLSGTGMPLSSLASMLEGVLGRPVLDETGLKDKYDFALTWDTGRPESILMATREQLGLELHAAKRPVEFLVVEPMPARSKP